MIEGFECTSCGENVSYLVLHYNPEKEKKTASNPRRSNQTSRISSIKIYDKMNDVNIKAQSLVVLITIHKLVFFSISVSNAKKTRHHFRVGLTRALCFQIHVQTKIADPK